MDNLNLFNPEEFNFTAHFTDTLKKINVADILPSIPKTKDINNDLIYKAIAVSCGSDIGSVDYNKYGEAGHKLKPINNKDPIFCDNVLLGFYTPKHILKKDKEEEKDGEEETQYKINNKMGTQRTEILNFITNKNIKIQPYDIQPLRIKPCDGRSHNFIQPDKAIIKRVYKKYGLEYNENSFLYVQIFKVALSSLKFETVLNLFNDENIESLLSLNIRVYDIDFTIDYMNSFITNAAG